MPCGKNGTVYEQGVQTNIHNYAKGELFGLVSSPISGVEVCDKFTTHEVGDCLNSPENLQRLTTRVRRNVQDIGLDD